MVAKVGKEGGEAKCAGLLIRLARAALGYIPLQEPVRSDIHMKCAILQTGRLALCCSKACSCQD